MCSVCFPLVVLLCMLGLCVRSHYLCISSVSMQHETVSYVNMSLTSVHLLYMETTWRTDLKILPRWILSIHDALCYVTNDYFHYLLHLLFVLIKCPSQLSQSPRYQLQTVFFFLSVQQSRTQRDSTLNHLKTRKCSKSSNWGNCNQRG